MNYLTSLNAWLEADEETGKRYIVLTVFRSGAKAGPTNDVHRMEAVELLPNRAGHTFKLLDVPTKVWYVYGRNKKVMQMLGFRRKRGKPTPEGKSGRQMHFIDNGVAHYEV